MPTTDVAARRFYGAFYLWTRLARLSPVCPHSRTFHQHSRHDKRSEYAAWDDPDPSANAKQHQLRSNDSTIKPYAHGRARPRLVPSRSRPLPKIATRQLSQIATTTKPPTHDSRRSQVSTSPEDEVPDYPKDSSGIQFPTVAQTEAETPFEAIQYTKWVLRSKVGSMYTVDYAVPHSILSFLQQRHGSVKALDLAQKMNISVEVTDRGRLIQEQEDAGLAGTKLLQATISGESVRLAEFMREMELAIQHQRDSMHAEPIPVGESVRTALRALTYPAVVITTSNGQLKPDEPLSNCRGVTVSSFTTVTLQPKVMISFNVKLPSRSWDAIKASGELRVHLLNASPRGAAIAHAFTQPHESPSEPFVSLTRQGIEVRTSQYPSPPIISAFNAVQGHMRARILPDKCVPVGDHIIVVAEVLEYHHVRVKSSDETVQSSAALAYADRAYRIQGESIVLPKLPSPVDTSSETSSDKSNAASSSTAFSPTAVRNTAFGSRHPIATQLRTYSTSSPISVDDISALVEPSARQRTVAEFLGVPDEDWRSTFFPHIKHVVNADRMARRATRHLKKGVKNGQPLTHEEIRALEQEVAVNQRIVHKVLSKPAAYSLQMMLDRGRVDFNRARWLEASIERGQAALAIELEQMDALLRSGRIEEDKYRFVKQRLEAHVALLTTEVTRLRQYVDEDGDGVEDFED